MLPVNHLPCLSQDCKCYFNMFSENWEGGLNSMSDYKLCDLGKITSWRGFSVLFCNIGGWIRGYKLEDLGPDLASGYMLDGQPRILFVSTLSKHCLYCILSDLTTIHQPFTDIYHISYIHLAPYGSSTIESITKWSLKCHITNMVLWFHIQPLASPMDRQRGPWGQSRKVCHKHNHKGQVGIKLTSTT